MRARLDTQDSHIAMAAGAGWELKSPGAGLPHLAQKTVIHDKDWVPPVRKTVIHDHGYRQSEKQ